MRFEYDPVKSIANHAKHGVSLAVACELDWDAALVWIDDRFEYGEMRMIALAPKTSILFTAWHLWTALTREGSLTCDAPIVAR